MAAIQGFKARLTIDGVPFSFSKASWKRERPKFEVPDSEGTAGDGTVDGATDGMAHILGRTVTTITIDTATYSDDANPFADPVDLSDVDATHAVVIMNDVADDAVAFSAERVRFTVSGCDIDVAGLQPCKLEGIVDGNCLIPGE